MITVQLLGGVSLRAGDAPLTGPPLQRHRISLLTLVVAAWPQPLARDRAVSLLWPERDTANARRLLNLAVHVLRSALGDRAIASTGDGLLLDPSQIDCDLHQLRAAIATGAADEIVRLYAGPLLDGFHLDGSTEWAYWLEARRSELAHAYVGALVDVAARQERAGDVQGRVRTCRRLVDADPHSGAHAQALMHALEAAGDRGGAIQHASEHAHRVREDLELEPDEGVLALARRLREAPPRRDAATVAADRPRLPSVAVLPFLNLSADPQNDYFADGITEDVIAHLANIRALKVISRSSVVPFQQRRHSLKEIGGALGATTVLDGSLRHDGDRVRIVATLIDVDTGQHLWAETYDRRVTDIFSIQTDVALHIAAALRAELSGEERTRVRKEPTTDFHAYELFLRGRECFIKYNHEGMTRGIEYFERAIARDPEFALAHATLGMAYSELVEAGYVPADVVYEPAVRAVANALRLDPQLGAARCAAGVLKMVLELDWIGAEQEFRRALELSPSNADSHDIYGRLCASLDRFDDALALQRRAHELDPLAHRTDSVTTLLRAARYEEGLAAAVTAAELDPGYDRVRATLGWAYILNGRLQDGIVELERAVAISPAAESWLAQLGEAYGLAGKPAKARRILRQLRERARAGFVSPYYFVYVYIGLGELDRAMDWLERAVAERSGPAYGIKGSFLLVPLRGHPRFGALLRRMKLD